MNKNIVTANRILLGLLVLVAGLLKVFVIGSAGVAGMLSGIVLFAWAPGFWAWVLILSEIVFGIAILAKWKLEYTVWPPIVIMLVAALFVSINWADMAKTQWTTVLMHLIIASNYLMLGMKSK